MNTQQVEAKANEIFGNNEDITISVDRNWVWIGGDTYPVKDEIKDELGGRFSSKRKEWYIVCEEAEEQTKNKETKKTKPKTKKVPKDYVPFEITWGSDGTCLQDGKPKRFGKTTIHAKNENHAKTVATQHVKKWCKDSSVNEGLRDIVRSSMTMASGKWTTATSKEGKAVLVKRIGGMWGGAYIMVFT